MSDTLCCPDCGATQPASSPEGRCRCCLMQQALGGSSAGPSTNALPPQGPERTVAAVQAVDWQQPGFRPPSSVANERAADCSHSQPTSHKLCAEWFARARASRRGMRVWKPHVWSTRSLADSSARASRQRRKRTPQLEPVEGRTLLSSYAYTTIDIPDSNTTSANYGAAINDSGQIAGFYPDGGFLLTAGNFTTLIEPGSPKPYPWPDAINNSGQVAGNSCCINGVGSNGGFLLSGGDYTTLNVPGSLWDSATGINNAGEIVGCFRSPDTTFPYVDGFIYSGGTYTTLAFPGAVSTQPSAINNLGQIVGFYLLPATGSPSNTTQGDFLYSDGTYTTFALYTYPPQGIVDYFYPTGINDSGQIVGYMYPPYIFGSDGYSHAVAAVLQGGSYTTFDFPESVATYPTGINDSGQIVGDYTLTTSNPNGFYHDLFLANPLPDPTSVTLTTTNSSIDYGQSETFTATVANGGSDGNVPTGSVQFYVNGRSYGSPVALVGGTASIVDTNLNAGSDDVTADYAPANAGFSSSGSQPVYIKVIVPTPTPPQVVAIAPVDSGTKLTSFTVSYNEPLDAGSASDSGLYHVLAGVTKIVHKRKNIVYTQPVAISKGVSSSGDKVTVRLRKPFKGKVEVTVRGMILAENGASSYADFMTIIN